MNEYQVVYCNGVCYWYYQDVMCYIVSFDFSVEVFGNIPYPNKAPSLRETGDDEPLEKSSKIAVWNDSIALFFYLELDPLLIDMWVMDSCSSGVEGSCPWTRHLTIGPLVGINKPTLFWANDVLFMENKDLEIVSYYLRTKKLAARSICKELFSNRVVICEKSLVSVLQRRAEKLRRCSLSVCRWVNETRKAKHGEMEQRQTKQTQASTSTAGSFESLPHMVTDEELVNCKRGLRQSRRKGVRLMLEKSIETSTSHSSPATYPPQQESIPPFTQQWMNLLAEFKKQIAI
ncbi:uncharacterized protein LOC21386598 [Morus notabilis]|uniref:uncharacterized protein LOC21386598 n=1 Tax=Morus notabilis TaxID=981085 RepID=UPI000CECFCF6|nr:uncharacterized protein LOC21386598 [Morus notabilis]